MLNSTDVLDKVHWNHYSLSKESSREKLEDLASYTSGNLNNKLSYFFSERYLPNYTTNEIIEKSIWWVLKWDFLKVYITNKGNSDLLFPFGAKEAKSVSFEHVKQWLDSGRPDKINVCPEQKILPWRSPQLSPKWCFWGTWLIHPYIYQFTGLTPHLQIKESLKIQHVLTEDSPAG